MKAFSEFLMEDNSFWAFVRFISEKLGYTNRQTGVVSFHSPEEISLLCNREHICISDEVIIKASLYLQKRADVINNVIQYNLMNAEQAEEVFESLYNSRSFDSKLIMNKQSGIKKKVNFFTAIITMIAEDALGGADNFDSDPRGLSYLIDNNSLLGGLSRRFDGAYPSIYSPKLVWEIKEYYYTTTFGSRIADGVYETQLDGYELKEIYQRTGHKIHHVLFVDSYKVWWEMGKPYTVRLLDALNMGLVDDVIFGKEVLQEWRKILDKIYKFSALK